MTTETLSPAAAATSTIARQAIVNIRKEVVGFELFDRSHLKLDHSSASDAEMLFNVLSLVEADGQLTHKTLHINCTHTSLAGGHLELIHPSRVVLEIPPLPDESVDLIESKVPSLMDLNKRGFKMAFNESMLNPRYDTWLPLASYIKFDLTVANSQEVAAGINYAQRFGEPAFMVEKVESEAQFIDMMNLGVRFFQGYWLSKPVLMQGQTLRPSHANIVQLINLVRRQASTEQIENLIKRDPTISFNLLKYINSAGFGLTTKITSFRQAVMLLGLNKMFRWAALLLSTSKDGGTAPVLHNTSVVRGRLMELLVAENPANSDDTDIAFVVGTFSMLDVMLNIPMPQALSTILLPEVLEDALLHRKGRLAPYLELTLACEASDEVAFARLARELNLTGHQINMAHLMALAWAENMGF
jgi:EAL and modified HD-GYP domain-containing signal transduction protein